jgi:CRISPR-associated endonuclease/helicase Cas3
LAYMIAGHHCGLPDWGSAADESSLEARLSKGLEDYSAFVEEIDLPAPRDVTLPNLVPSAGGGFCAQFLIRLVYSCLVDADFLNTESVLDPDNAVFRHRPYSLKDLSRELDSYLVV